MAIYELLHSLTGIGHNLNDVNDVLKKLFGQ